MELIDLVNSVIIFVINSVIYNLKWPYSEDPRLRLSKSWFFDLFISSDTSICFIMVFPPLENSVFCLSFYWIFVKLIARFPISRADWDGLHGHLKDVQLEDIFKLSVSAAASVILNQSYVGKKNCWDASYMYNNDSQSPQYQPKCKQLSTSESYINILWLVSGWNWFKYASL